MAVRASLPRWRFAWIKPSAGEPRCGIASHPRGSQIGAWASPQSRVIPSRAFIEAKERALEARYAGRDVPRPPHWGGYVLKPHAVEFWQHRDSRLHDRVRYTLEDDGKWRVERLGP